MKEFFVLVVLVNFLSLPLLAQDKVEVFGGYQYLHTGNITVDGQTDPNSSQGFNGWNASATFYFSKYLGVTGDFGGAYASIEGVLGHVYTYTGGPVLSFRKGKINPFVHLLVGAVDLGASEDGVSASRTGLTAMFGGGADLRVLRRLSWRAQMDYLRSSNITLINDEVQNVPNPPVWHLQISTGPVFHF